MNAIDITFVWAGVPPTRSLGVSKRGRIFVNEAYRNWKKQAHRWVTDETRRVLGVKTPKDLEVEHIFLRVTFYMKDLHKADLDNLIKPVLDAIVLAGFIPDDKAQWARNVGAYAVRSDVEQTIVNVTAWTPNEVAYKLWYDGLTEWEQNTHDAVTGALDALDDDHDNHDNHEIRLE